MPEKAAKPACKPGSVVDSHSSRRRVTATLKQPTRIRRGPRHWIPIWSCSKWGLPCRSVAGLAVRSYRTISPLPSCRSSLGRYLSVALSVGLRRPGVTWHFALRSPDFPRRSRRNDATVRPTSPGGILALWSRKRGMAVSRGIGVQRCNRHLDACRSAEQPFPVPDSPFPASPAIQRLARRTAQFRRQLGCR